METQVKWGIRFKSKSRILCISDIENLFNPPFAPYVKDTRAGLYRFKIRNSSNKLDMSPFLGGKTSKDILGVKSSTPP